jgi:hypothetical protein
MRLRKNELDSQLPQVETASDREALMTMWRGQFDLPPPRGISIKMMKLAIAYQLQCRAYGSLKATLRRHLHDMVSGSGRSGAAPGEVGVGTKLLRQWHGTVYEGVVEADGVLINGRKYKSLTEAACDITGVRWSGPRFFGITKVKSQ